jgi:RNA ligase (TIGR02306 family)
MGRKLATIQTISKIEPIEGADQIEKATILGWQLVVKKGDFKVGDNCCYFEIDSFLPIKPEFEFLRKACLKKLEDGTEGFRIRTIRLRKQISQGLAMPLSILLEVPGIHYYGSIEVGTDITEAMGVMLWQPPIPADLKGLIKGPFPSFMPKTDETRVQVLQAVLTRYKGKECYVTEKVDGASCTVYLYNGEFGVCSRNLDLKESEGNAFWKAVREAKVEEKMRKSFIGNWAIQGELLGAGLQENRLHIEGKKILWFNVFDIDRFKYLNFREFQFCMNKQLELETVPIITEEYDLDDNIENLVKMSIGRSLIYPKAWREGIVIRPIEEMIDLQMSSEFNNGRVSFKVVNPEYLIEEA